MPLCFHEAPRKRFFTARKASRQIRLAGLLLGFWVLTGLPVRADWPQFRGPYSDGHVSAPGDTNLAGFPLHWSETENVRWKTAIPYRGWSTPVVMGGQVWLTTATEDGHDFFAIGVDADTGKILFNEKVFHADNPEPLGNNVNCYATPSPVIEPGRVYVHFGSYGICASSGHRERQGDLETRGPALPALSRAGLVAGDF